MAKKRGPREHTNHDTSRTMHIESEDPLRLTQKLPTPTPVEHMILSQSEPIVTPQAGQFEFIIGNGWVFRRFLILICCLTVMLLLSVTVITLIDVRVEGIVPLVFVTALLARRGTSAWARIAKRSGMGQRKKRSTSSDN